MTALRSTADELYNRVALLGALASRAEATTTVRTMLVALSEALAADDAARLAACLPPEVGAMLEGARAPRALAAADLAERVASEEGVPRGRALERTQAVGAAIAELLEPEVLELLRHHLPHDVAELFTRRERTHAPNRGPTPHRRPRTTLAEGRAGSRHPLSEARAERAQSESVAGSEDPHAATKLSSSPGLTQEREGETLASGRPRRGRPISEG